MPLWLVEGLLGAVAGGMMIAYLATPFLALDFFARADESK